MLTERDVYPLTIISDRYHGCYSGGEFLAFNLDYDDVPEEVNSDDNDCRDFWENESKNYVIGKGGSVDDALIDLIKRMYYEI